jgi:hypothetical protein
MANDDEAARRARANALRQRIAALKPGQTRPEDSEDESKTQGPGSNEKPGDETTPLGESPREFVNRRMRELDRDKRKGDVSDG